MTDRFTIGSMIPNHMPPGVVRKAGKASETSMNRPQGTNEKSFEEILQGRMVAFSQHAENRLQQRGIRLQPDQLTKLETAIDQAAAKGAKESLIVMREVALIVNVPSRVVVTAMDERSMKNNVFTQIDSAVIVP